MAKTKAPSGPIPVNGDVTPISKKPIQQVNADNWHEMSITELYEQRMTLDKRLDYAKQIGHVGMMQQINHGMQSLDLIITSRATTTDDTRLI